MDDKYFEKLVNTKEIKLLFIGKDPYPTNPNGIPFCKPTIKELKDGRCSGRYLLNGLGINIDNYSDTDNSTEIFYDLLDKKEIGFLNASYSPPPNKKLSEEQRNNFKNKNENIIKKANCVVTSIGAKDLLRQYLSHNELDKIEIVCHPDIRNRNNKIHKEMYNLIWETENGLLNKFNLL